MSIVEQFRTRTMVEAAGLLAERGYENVRAETLAKVSRMSLGTFYRHYGSKRGYTRVLRDLVERELCRCARI
ncbi:helix-turn-helix domain-containing protein, partial [Pyxidicoccus sp. 3LG]